MMNNESDDQMTIPPLFRCPISLDLFKDPVTLSTGQTYDRSSIEEWLAAGNLTCPVTMQRIHDPSIIVPNHALRHLIDRWLDVGRGGGLLGPVHELPHPDNPSLVYLRNDLESEGATVLVKLQAVQRVWDMSVESPAVAGALVRLGVVSLLLRLVFRGAESDLSGEYASLIEQALGCVLTLLAQGGVKDVNLLEEDSNLRSLSFLLDHGGSDTMKARICRLVEILAISSSSGVERLHVKLGENRALLNSIISLLRRHSEVSDVAVSAIQSLCCLQSSRENLVREGVLRGLIAYISIAKKSGQARLILLPTLSTIERLLLEVDLAKQAILDDPDSICTLVEMVFRVSDHETSESAVGSLTILCGGSSAAREKAIDAGAVTHLLLLIQSQCSVSIKTKARILLKMLRS